jgi:lipopolysaccharide cholinephosphotransferase
MLTEHQEYLYKLYKEIDAICKEHNIKYQLAGGTLIGAIRHRGFIPWDDDMDITMTRKEWNKFVKVCADGALPENRVLECQENNHSYHNMVARYTDTTCTALHKTQLMHDDTAGFVIDILIYDGLPNTDEALKEYTADLMLYSDLLNDSLVYSYRYGVNAFRYFRSRLEMRFKGRDYVLKKLEDKMSRYDEDECPYLVLHWGGIPLVFARKTFGDSNVFLPIEDTIGQCPDRPFDYLVEHYGDEWMYIPPVTEQQSHEAVFNTEIPYPVVRKEIYHFVTQKKVKKKYRAKKYIALSHMKAWQKAKDMRVQIKVLASKMECKQQFGEKEEEIIKYKNEKNYFALREIFNDYIAYQNDRTVSGRGDYSGAYRYFNPILIDINTGFFELVLETLFNTGSISVAKRFIEVYEYAKGCKTAYMQGLETEIEVFREAVSAFASKEYQTAYPLIQQLLEKHPNNISIIKLAINRYLKTDNPAQYMDIIAKLVNHGIKCSPDDGDLAKYKLDTEFADNKEQTLISYVDAWYGTYNGLIRLDIMDIIKENLDFYFDYCDKNIKNKDENGESLALVMIDKLNEIVQDDYVVIGKKFELLEKMANIAKNPVRKAEKQHRLIKYILEILKKYNYMFHENKYPEIETIVTKWYYRCYKEINHSDFVTYTSAEIIACEDFNQINMLMEKLDKYMEKIDKNSQEYLYCLELRGKVLYLRGESEKSAGVLIKCGKDNNDPYLNQLLRDDYNQLLSDIYGKLYYAYNIGFTDKYAEISGLEPEAGYLKGIENKKRLIHHYKEELSRYCHSVKEIIELLVKVGSLTQGQANRIIKRYGITGETGFNFKIITAICKCIDDINTEVDDRDYFLEELSGSDYSLDKQEQDDHFIFV